MKYRIAVALIVIASFSVAQNRGVDVSEESPVSPRIDRLMRRYHSHRSFAGAVLVAENGKIVYREAFGLANIDDRVPNTPTTRFGLASVSKQFTSMIILQLVEEGTLRLDGKVTEYLPDYPETTGDNITIHHLLTHTSGIYQDSPIEGARASRRLENHSRDALLAYFENHKLLFEPGEGFQYTNFNYNLLAIIAETVIGTPYEELLRKRIFDPVGMKNTCVGAKSGPGSIAATGYDYEFLTEPRPVEFTHESVAIGAGDLYSTVDDLFLWDRALYGNELLSERYRDMLLTSHTDVGYGYGWQVGKYPVNDAGDSVTAIYHDGGAEGVQCCIYRMTDDQRLIVVLSNHREPWIHIRLSRPKEDMAPSIIKTLYGGECELPGRSAAYALALAVEDSGLGVIGARYDELRRSSSDQYAFDADEFYNVGLSYLWKSEYQKAYGFLEIAVDSLGVDYLQHAWQCHAVYGEAAVRCKHFDKAIPVLERSLELKPGNSSATYWLKMAKILRTR